MSAGAEPLDNTVWHALTTYHRHVAEGAGRARRYHPDVSVFSAVRELDDGGWADLAALAGSGRHLVLSRAEVPDPPAGWKAVQRGRGHQMVAPSLRDTPVVALRTLAEGDVPAMLELIALTEPGPFRPRTIELGTYVAVVEHGRLVAMAGERLHLPGYTEVSAVCTRPEARGRGLAAALTHHVASGILARGETPILHVAEHNHNARRVYERLGFGTRRLVDFVVLRAP